MGASTVVACTAGLNSCGFGDSVAVIGSGEAFGLANVAVDAHNGETINVSTSAQTGQSGLGGCAGGAYATLVPGANGEFVFTYGANAGFACTDANGTAVSPLIVSDG